MLFLGLTRGPTALHTGRDTAFSGDDSFTWRTMRWRSMIRAGHRFRRGATAAFIPALGQASMRKSPQPCGAGKGSRGDRARRRWVSGSRHRRARHGGHQPSRSEAGRTRHGSIFSSSPDQAKVLALILLQQADAASSESGSSRSANRNGRQPGGRMDSEARRIRLLPSGFSWPCAGIRSAIAELQPKSKRVSRVLILAVMVSVHCPGPGASASNSVTK